MIDSTQINDRMIIRAQNLSTPLGRLQELAPRLLAVLPDTIGGCAERLGATRLEITDAAEFELDQIADRGGRLVRRDRTLARADAADPFYVTRST
ncbi:hypothetical protein JP75_11555 [Devosia riboflavina]|uniref:Uncharacterized protein n=1 Tax=Devosia riboflavina TaxID=46914 RepID=A0A087M279_9HYPH|nr:hypothetical protein [Devosia riboflavina]KFL30982.1 hypothetical protein JP75_11555 [Devosia riboflavina]